MNKNLKNYSNMNWNYPTNIWFGLDRVVEIEKACENLKIDNPLIVTDPGILETDIINKVKANTASPSTVNHSSIDPTIHTKVQKNR